MDLKQIVAINSGKADKQSRGNCMLINWKHQQVCQQTHIHTMNPPPRQTLYKKMIIGNKLFGSGDNQEQKGRQLCHKEI
jgi:hypothetical protein